MIFQTFLGVTRCSNSATLIGNPTTSDHRQYAGAYRDRQSSCYKRNSATLVGCNVWKFDLMRTRFENAYIDTIDNIDTGRGYILPIILSMDINYNSFRCNIGQQYAKKKSNVPADCSGRHKVHAGVQRRQGYWSVSPT